MQSHQLPPPVQGMSQQASAMRNASAGDLQVNAVSDPVNGLGQRQGTQHIRMLSGLSTSPVAFLHWVQRDRDERYVFGFDGFMPLVFDLEGTSYPVIQSDPTAVAYLADQRPRDVLRALTVSDRTYLVNTSKTVELLEDNTPERVEEAVIWIRGGAYAAEYIVNLDGTEIKHETLTSVTTAVDAAGGTPTSLQRSTSIHTTTIAERLVDGWSTDQTNNNADQTSSTGLAGIAGFDVTVSENFIRIKRDDDASFEIEVSDSAGGTLVSVAHRTVPSFDRLPDQAEHGMTVEVAGLAGEDSDNYWVRFEAKAGSGFGEGVWQETAAPGTAGTIDASKMPRALDRKQDDASGTQTGTPYGIYFELTQPEWQSRPAGDPETNPAPSFVGQKIDTLFLLADRLAFTSSSNVIASRTGDFSQFFKTSAISLTDDDRIDATINTAEVVTVKYAVPQTQEILLIGEEAQVSIPTDQIITPANFRFSPATSVRADLQTRPAIVNRSMFLPYRSTEYSGVREYSTTGIEGLKDHLDITYQVPRLIEGSVTRMAVADEVNALFMLASGDASRIYVYQWLDSGPNRIQSAPSYWEMDSSVLSIEVIDADLWLLVSRPEGVTLERIALDPLATPAETPLAFRLDRLAFLTPPPAASSDGSSGDDDDGGSGGGGSGGGSSGGPGGVIFPGGEINKDVVAITAESEGLMVPASPTVTLSIPYEAADGLQVVRTDTGELVPYTIDPSDRTRLTLPEDIGGTVVVVGVPFEWIFDLGETRFRVSSRNGETALIGGRVQVDRYRIEYNLSGPFEAFPIFDDGVADEATELAPIHNVGDNIAQSKVHSGYGDVPVYASSSEFRLRLRSSSYWPLWITGLEWQGHVFKGTDAI